MSLAVFIHLRISVQKRTGENSSAGEEKNEARDLLKPTTAESRVERHNGCVSRILAGGTHGIRIWKVSLMVEYRINQNGDRRKAMEKEILFKKGIGDTKKGLRDVTVDGIVKTPPEVFRPVFVYDTSMSY